MFHRQNARQPIATALLALLLALTSAFSCIGLSGWASFRRQLAALDAQYTTVAYTTNIERDYSKGVEEWQEDGSIRYEDGTTWASPERVKALAEKAPGLLSWSTNVLAAAHTPDQKGFSSGTVDPMAYVDVYDLHRYSMSVMAVRCLAVKENPYAGSDYYYRFEWVEPVCRMAAYDLPEPGKVFDFFPDYDMLSEEAGTPLLFEEGKTYLLRGDFLDFTPHYWMRWVEDTEDEPGHMENYWYRYTADNWEELTGRDATRDPNAPQQRLEFLWVQLPRIWEDDWQDKDAMDHPYPLTPNFYLETKQVLVEETEERSYWTSISYPPEGSWPFYAEYEGDWRDFLETEEGRVWRDEIIPCFERGYDSVAVLLTDNVQSLSQFCREESALLEGRFITEEEYKTGAAVCMVGADYALYNNLQVGDTLTLDLYRPAYLTTNGCVHLMANLEYFYYTHCMPLVEENRLDVTRDYTIVGLYTAPVRPMDPDGHGFRGDTVLAPKASAPEVVSAAGEDKVTPLLNTLVLKNGSIEEFEAYMAENDAANRFIYFDYGYSEVRESVEALEANALRLAALGSAAFLIGGLVFLLAGFGRMSASARGLRLLGAKPGKVTGEMLAALLPLTAAGVFLGAILGGALYGKVSEAVLSQTLAPDWPGVAAVAALELLALSAAAAIWATALSRRGLMRRKQE